MVKEKLPSFIATHLDPANRFIEVVCGLIMVLTFTPVGSQLVSDDPSGVRKLLIAAVGCNVAWGIIDGVMFVMNGLTERFVESGLSRRSGMLRTKRRYR